jgi:hypothetical protein
MEASIDYLNTTHGDLLDAARRERRGGVPGSPRAGRGTRWLVAAASVIVVAGLVGGIVRSGGLSEITGALSGGGDDSAPAAGTPQRGSATGATGSTGGVSGGYLEEPLPQPSPAPGEQGGDDGSGDAGTGAVGVGPRVIRTAELVVDIPRDAFDARFAEAVDIAEENGGFVAESDSRNRSGSLTLRVPAERFDETLRALRDLGTIGFESLRGRDVTAEYVDLQARLRIAKARREVLLELMQEAVSIEQTIRVQNALDDTQLRVEQLQGQLRLLDDQTSFATVTLHLNEEGVERQVEPPSIPNALDRAVAGTVGVVAAIVIGLGYLLPLLVIGGVGWFIATRIRRRRTAG